LYKITYYDFQWKYYNSRRTTGATWHTPTAQRSQKHDGQSNRKKLNVFGCSGGGWNPSPTKLGKVILDLEHILAPRKLLGSDAQFHRYGVLKIWQKPDSISL